MKAKSFLRLIDKQHFKNFLTISVIQIETKTVYGIPGFSVFPQLLKRREEGLNETIYAMLA